ncbi:MAG: MFS transporter [Candidatus Nanopelagicaceae bacterium]|nr:MFS transporter [Candidatus Nanopelagicaceae bacterium]
MSADLNDRLPPHVRRMLLGITLSALGNGLVLPFAFVYFHSIRDIPTSTAGLIFSYGALISLIVAPGIGTLIDKWGPKPILIISLLISAVGYSSLSLIRSTSDAFLVITICSIGQSAMWPSQGALNTELTPDHLRERIYGSQFALLNLGLGIGGIVSSLIVSLDRPITFELLYIGDGLSYIVYLLVVLSLKKTGNRTKEQRDYHASLEGSWSDVLKDKTFRKVWIVALFAIFMSYSQLEVGFTSFATTVADVKPSRLAWAYAVNTAMIAIFQLWVIKKLEKLPRARGLAIAMAFWALSWAALAMAGISHGFAVPAIIVCQFIFAIGEMVWSPILPAVVNQLAPDHLRGRYNSASTNTWQIGMIMGPAAAGVLLGAGLWALWISLLFGGLVVLSFFALRLKLPDRPVSETVV